jgi:DNA polymerase elongation subunit (family B)
MADFDTIVTYNGKSFDVPFVNARMKKNGIDYEMLHQHLDLIYHVRSNKSTLGLTSCSLKSVEKLLGIGREDTIDGGESIELYYQYLKSNSDELKQKILLHNFEDVYNLPEILKIFDRVNYKINPEGITLKQKSFLNSLLKQKKFVLTRNLDELSKYEASKLIDYLYSGKSSEYDSFLMKASK